MYILPFGQWGPLAGFKQGDQIYISERVTVVCAMLNEAGAGEKCKRRKPESSAWVTLGHVSCELKTNAFFRGIFPSSVL